MGAILNTRILAGQGLNISTALWSIGAAVNKVHGVWKLYVKGTTYLNPDNFFGLSAGLIYETLIGDRLFLKLPTVPFFVMAKFLDLFEQEDAWYKQYILWLETLKNIQPLYTKLTIDYGQYKISFFKYTIHCLYFRIERIALCTFKLGLESFKLVMRIMDIIELVTLDPALLNDFANQSVRESGLHIPRCLSTLIKNKCVFIKRLESKQAGIAKALEWLGCEKIKAVDVINSAASMLDHCERGLEYYSKAGHFVGNAVTNLGKKFIYDWSPDGVKKWLKDNHLDSRSEQKSVTKKNLKKQTHRPPQILIYYDPTRLSKKKGIKDFKQATPSKISKFQPVSTFISSIPKSTSPKKILKGSLKN